MKFVKKMLIFGTIGAILIGSAVSADGITVDIRDDRYDYGYIISEITPKANGRGAVRLVNNNTNYPDNNVMFYAYRLPTMDIDPETIIAPAMYYKVYEIIIALANVPAHEGRSVSLAVSSFDVALPINEDDKDRMEFYYSVGVNVGNMIYWQTARKISYKGCAEAAKYKEGVVCKLREEIDKTFYYDAYVNGVLVTGLEDEKKDETGGENEEGKNDSENEDVNNGSDDGVGGGVEEDSGDGENTGDFGMGGEDAQGEDIEPGAEYKDKDIESILSIVDNDASKNPIASVVKNIVTGVMSQAATMNAVVAVGDGEENDMNVVGGARVDDVGQEEGVAITDEAQVRRVTKIDWAWLWWMLAVLICIAMFVVWRRRREKRSEKKTKGAKRGRLVRSA